MPDFRCGMLDERGAFPSETSQPRHLDAAILHASNILHTSNQSSSSRQVHSFEVWSGTSRLFPPVRLTSLSATFEGPKVSDCMGAVETAHAMH